MRKSNTLATLSIIWIVSLSWSVVARAQADNPINQVDIQLVRLLFPAAQSLAPLNDRLGTREVLGANGTLGYIFLSDQHAPIPAYSGRPVSILIGLDRQAKLQEPLILHHEEPILVVGVTDADLSNFIRQFTGADARDKVRVGASSRPGYIGIDGITGATITAMVINSSIMRSAHRVSTSLGLPLQPSVEQTYKESSRQPQRELKITPATKPASESPRRPSADSMPANPTTIQTESIAEELPWRQLWRDKTLELSLLTSALLLLLSILFFQDWLVVHKVLFHRIRVGYLLFTLFFLGVYCQAQLSVINLLAFIRILFDNFRWDTLLLDPLAFVLWGFVAVSILLWGRGVFCGWLCPFGALQELVHKLAERVQLPSYEFPPMVHERLWSIKYFLLIALVGLSLESMAYAARLAEVEPFKTTFVLRFNRELWFSAYAALLIVVSAFNSKFYCKYLCPLGAGLSFFTRFRIFDWLRRRRECGKPCQSCAAQCQISAIKPTGEIIDNECHYCLECQVTYWDEHRCPPLVEKRTRQEAKKQKTQAIIARESN